MYSQDTPSKEGCSYGAENEPLPVAPFIKRAAIMSNDLISVERIGHLPVLIKFLTNAKICAYDAL